MIYIALYMKHIKGLEAQRTSLADRYLCNQHHFPDSIELMTEYGMIWNEC